MNHKVSNDLPPQDFMDEEKECEWLRHETIKRFQLEEGFHKRYKLVSRFQVVREHVQFAWQMYDEDSLTFEQLISHLKQAKTCDTNGVWWTMNRNEQIWYRYENDIWMPVNPPFDLVDPPFDFEELDYWGRPMRMRAGFIDDSPQRRHTFQKSEVAQPQVNRRFTEEEIADLVKKIGDNLRRELDDSRRELQEVEDTLDRFLRGIIPNP